MMKPGRLKKAVALLATVPALFLLANVAILATGPMPEDAAFSQPAAGPPAETAVPEGAGTAENAGGPEAGPGTGADSSKSAASGESSVPGGESEPGAPNGDEKEEGKEAESGFDGDESGPAGNAEEEPGTAGDAPPLDGDGFGDEMADAAPDEGMAAMDGILPLAAGTVTVSTWPALVNAIQDGTSTLIYLANDIAAGNGGAKIPLLSLKSQVVIDGSPAGAPAGGYTLTTYTSNSFTDTLYSDPLLNLALASVTFQNMRIVNPNPNGVVYVSSLLSLAVTTVSFNNVAFSGAMLCTNPLGTVNLNGMVAQVSSGAYTARGLAEAKNLNLAGACTITSGVAGSGLVSLGSGSTASVASGANITLSTPGAFINTGGAGTASFSMNADSAFTAACEGGFTYQAQALSGVTVGQRASFTLRQNTASANGTLRVSSALQVAQGGTFQVLCGANTGAAVQFTASGASATFTNPAAVAIYTPANRPIRFSGTGTLGITADTINLWSSATNPDLGPQALPPAYIWNKNAVATAFTLTAGYNSDTVQSLTSNYATGDPAPQRPSTANFNMAGTALLAFGALPVVVNTPATASAALTGTAPAGTALSAQYTDVYGAAQSVSGTADGSGNFSLPFGSTPPQTGTTVSVRANTSRLYALKTAQVAGLAALSFYDVPSTMGFAASAVPKATTTISRQNAAWQISVSDTRAAKSPWSLLVSVPQPFTAQVGANTYTLPGALVYVDAGGNQTQLSATPYKIFSSNQPVERTNIGWAANRGILLLVNPGEIISNTPYTATIQWTLSDAP